MTQIVVGSVSIESDILFLGPKLYGAPEENKREFLRALRSFPEWHRTTFWCHNSAALRPVSADRKKTKPVNVAVKSMRMPQQTERYIRIPQREYSKRVWTYLNDYSVKWAERIKTKWVDRIKEFWEKSD
jgi:hypothetical protein